MTTLATRNLTGAALDWAVAKALGAEFYPSTINAIHAKVDGRFIGGFVTKTGAGVAMPDSPFIPSRSWFQAGPLIERERICFVDRAAYLAGGFTPKDAGDGQFAAFIGSADRLVETCVNEYEGLSFDECQLGPTHLVAAMRCFVASRLGEAVDVPAELDT